MATKNNETISALLEKEYAHLATLKDKRAVLDAKIKKSEATIESYTLLQNSAKYSSFTETLTSKGISFDDIMGALQNDNLASLQDKLSSLAVINP